MALIRLGVIIIGFFLIGLGTYALMYRHAYFSKEQTVNVEAIRDQTEEGLPDFFGALLIVAGGVLIVSELIIRDNKDN